MLSDGTQPFRKQRDTSRYQFKEIKQRNMMLIKKNNLS